MKQGIVWTFALLLLLGAVCLAASCSREDPPAKTPESDVITDDGSATVPKDDAFWLQEDMVFSPTDIDRTGTDQEVSDLYQALIETKPDNVVLTSGEQALVLQSAGNGSYDLAVYLVKGEDYVPLFSTAYKDLLPGFGKPTAYQNTTVGGKDAVVMTGGNGGHTFTLTCTALKETGLLHFEMTATLGGSYSLTGRDFGLAFTGTPAVSYGQMPVSIYGNMAGYDNVGIAMPAAYLWDKGREAVVLFDYTDMIWMSSSTYLPGRSGYVDAKNRGGYTAFGLCYGQNQSGGTVSCGTLSYGRLTLNFYLFGGFSAQRQGISCMARKAEVMASVHPTYVAYPTVRSDVGGTLSWERFAAGTVTGLLHDLAHNTTSMNLSDPILTSEARGNTYYVGYARQHTDRYTMTDYSCNNNWLSAFSAYNRLHPRADASTMLSAKMDTLQFFYDPDSDMYRWGFRYKNQVGLYSMPWQNGFYHTDIYRSSMHASPADFSPAALSNLLSTVQGGWTELIQKLNYVLPQWTDPVNKKAETQQDVPALVVVYEPWQIGSYAYTCLKAYDVTGEKNYVDLAATALNKVINEVTFKVENQVYTKEYTDSATFPITEVFGTANGTYACYRLFELTGEEKWLTYSEAFFGMLAQLTFWYDDNLSSAAKTSTWVGLFEPHGGASHPCPWESIEAVLPLTEILHATGDYLFNDLILAILNTQRVSSYNFYPVVWPSSFSGEMAYRQADFYYIPTEPMYNSFAGGNSDYGALYMSSISFWNYLMYEAFATVNDKDVMILNTDVQADFESAARGAVRNFVLYNPKDESVTVMVTYRQLGAGNYLLTQNGETKEYTAAELKSGITYTLSPRASLRIRMTSSDVTTLVEANRDTMTRYRLATAYNAVVEKVQALAREQLAIRFPTASSKDLTTLSNYVLTYMTYEDAMAIALSSTQAATKNAFVYRKAATADQLAAYETSTAKIPEAYEALIRAVDTATTHYRVGDCETAYALSDAIIAAIASGTEADLAAKLANS